MAGARVEITKDTVSPALDRLLDALSGDGRDAMLKDMGESLLISTRDRAARQVTPEGDAWDALSPRYKRRKDKRRPGVPLLKYDNHMLGDGFQFQVTAGAGELMVGTVRPYGAAQHFGYKNPKHRPDATGIPARRWLGLSVEDAVELEAIAQEHIQAAMEG